MNRKKIEFRSYNDASNLVAFDFRIIASDAEMVLFPPEKYESREFNLLQTIILQLNAGRKEFATGDERCRFSAAFAEESAKQYKWSKLSEGLPFWTDFYGKTKLPIASSKKGTKVTILYANSVGHFSTANNDKIRDKLLASGYNIEFKRLDSADLIARMRAKNYTATLWGFLPDYIDPDALLSPLVRSGQQYNWSSFNNKAVDTLLELGGSGLDGIVRKQIYDKVFDAMGKDCRISFLGSEHGRYVVSRKWDFSGLSGLGMLTARFRDVKRRAP